LNDTGWKRLTGTLPRKGIPLAAGLIVVGVILFYFLKPHGTVISLPKNILQLHLNEEVTGEQAQKMVDKMHGKSVTPDETAVGMYQSPNGSAILYISHYNSENRTLEQFDKMAVLIRESPGGVFSHFREMSVEGKKVYLCLGLGQAHYIFLNGKDLLWLAVDLQIAQAAMHELVRMKTTQK
jgi:hypothetical protein